MNLFKSTAWTLHNPLKGWTLQGLSLEEAQLVVATLTTAEQNVVVVWNKNWHDWHMLNSETCEELFIEYPARGNTPPPIPQHLLEDTPDEITEVRPMMSTKRSSINRRHSRYIARISCDVIVGSHVFTTYSRDISAGGICFEEALPEWVAGYFTVIIKGDQPIELTCVMVEDQKKDKFRAEIIEGNQPENSTRFRTWLESAGFPLLTKV